MHESYRNKAGRQTFSYFSLTASSPAHDHISGTLLYCFPIQYTLLLKASSSGSLSLSIPV